jgi:preprotein translocase subunit SecF
VNVRDAITTFRGHRTPHLNIVGRKRLWFIVSGILILLSLAGLLIRQLNLSLEFEGGAELRLPNRAEASVEEIRDVLEGFGRGEAEIQEVGGGDVVVTTESLSDLGDRREQLLGGLAETAGINPDEINISDVGPSFGGQIGAKALRALIVFLVLVTLYISLRFEWKMALAAQAALLHDLLITAGIYALVGQEVTPATVIAILTIMGYSLYDTVVIFDRVKENTESMAAVARDTYSGVVNTSLNEVFMRSVNTSLVVLLPILSLLLFGGDTLKDFAFALFVGVLIGTYSSIFMASPLLAVLKEREPRIAQLRSRATARTVRPATRPPAGAATLQSVPRATPVDGEGDRELEPAGTGTPKPPGLGTAGRPSPSRPRSKRKPPAKRRRR